MRHCCLTALKYLWRAPYKGKTRQDLEKGVWYLRKAVETAERMAADAT
jgi:TPR repeat protein